MFLIIEGTLHFLMAIKVDYPLRAMSETAYMMNLPMVAPGEHILERTIPVRRNAQEIR